MQTLLIVDDAAEYVNSLRNALKSDFSIVCAGTLEEAKKKTNKTINIILADIRLDESNPDNRDGILFLEWVKQNYPDKPVILMSAYGNAVGKLAIEKGAAAFMKKPVYLSELKEKLKNLFNENARRESHKNEL